MEKLLEVKALTKKYQEGSIENKVVDNVNLQVGKGEFVIIIGKAPANPLRHNGLSGGIPASGRSFPLFFPFTDSKQPLQSPPCGLRCPSAWSL